VTVLDWGIVAFALAMAYWGYQQGLVVGALTLAGFAVGAWLGSRLGPELLADGSQSPYAPVTALAGALLLGGIVAVTIEGAAVHIRHRVIRGSLGEVLDGSGGALLIAALGLGIAWLFGAVALNAPNAHELRSAVQRSAILRGLNHILPPAGVLNTLNRIDPRLSINGPDARVGTPDPQLAADPEVAAAGDSVVRVLGTACGLGIEGSGWVAAPDTVVTNAHVVAGEQDTTVSTGEGSARFDATPVRYDTVNDLAVLRVTGLGLDPLTIVPEPRTGTSGAVLGYPENGPFSISPARLAATQLTISQDSYGNGPVRRLMTSLRGRIRSGNSGGPMVDGAGGVLTTVFASTTSGKPGGFGVPNAVVSQALLVSGGEVSTGPCAR
jgi:S1-C subfamily serine protease